VCKLKAEISGGSVVLTYRSKRDAFPCDSVRWAIPCNVRGLPSGVELEFRSGIALLLDFDSPALRDEFARSLPPPGRPRKALWASRGLSNFEYLLEVNRLSGRSFDNTSQYPILPWVVDPFRPEVFRDLQRLFQQAHTSSDLVLQFLHGTEKFHSVSQLWDGNAPLEFPELAPEFFCMPEAVFADDCVFPAWAANAFDFVYRHRKALESEAVSANLHYWIDLVFGCKQPREEKALGAPSILFEEPHIPRGKKGSEPARSLTIKLGSGSLVFAQVFKREEKSVSVVTIDSHRQFARTVLALREAEPILERSTTLLRDVDVGDKRVRFTGFRGNVLLSGGETFYADGEQTVRFPKHSHCIGADSHWIVAPGSDCMVYTFETANPVALVRSVWFHGDQVRACCVATRFHVFVLATDAGFVVCPLERGSARIAVNMAPCKIRRVCVTNCWGLVLVYFTRQVDARLVHSMSVFTINGVHLRSVVLDDEITAITTWADRDGFDHVAIAGRNGIVFASEAYLLEFSKIVLRAKAMVIELSYNRKARLLIGISADGVVQCQTVDS
jgi:hypothetical protein